jgi:hypothetical protein
VRTPLTKSRKGGLKDTSLDDLLVSLLTVCPWMKAPAIPIPNTMSRPSGRSRTSTLTSSKMFASAMSSALARLTSPALLFSLRDSP